MNIPEHGWPVKPEGDPFCSVAILFPASPSPLERRRLSRRPFPVSAFSFQHFSYCHPPRSPTASSKSNLSALTNLFRLRFESEINPEQFLTHSF